MATMTRLTCVLLVLAAACGKKATDGKTIDETKPDDTKPDPCAVAGAKQLPAWTVPQGCSVKVATDPTWIRTDADIATYLPCGPDVPEFDYPAPPLLTIHRTLSPSTLGIDAYDDGKTITWVSRQREACPGEYPPMPAPVNYVFVASGLTGDRVYAESRCRVAFKCP